MEVLIIQKIFINFMKILQISKQKKNQINLNCFKTIVMNQTLSIEMKFGNSSRVFGKRDMKHFPTES